MEKLLSRYVLPFHKRLHAFSVWSTWGARTVVQNTNGMLVNFTEKVLFWICFKLELFKTKLRAEICARLNCQGYPHVHIFIWAIRRTSHRGGIHGNGSSDLEFFVRQTKKSLGNRGCQKCDQLDSNLREHLPLDLQPNALTTKPWLQLLSRRKIFAIYLITILMYTEASPDPINPRGGGQLPNPNKCN